MSSKLKEVPQDEYFFPFANFEKPIVRTHKYGIPVDRSRLFRVQNIGKVAVEILSISPFKDRTLIGARPNFDLRGAHLLVPPRSTAGTISLKNIYDRLSVKVANFQNTTAESLVTCNLVYGVSELVSNQAVYLSGRRPPINIFFEEFLNFSIADYGPVILTSRLPNDLAKLRVSLSSQPYRR